MLDGSVILDYPFAMKNIKRVTRTCTFPTYPYRILRHTEYLRKGDLFNYCKPEHPWCDAWDAVATSVDTQKKVFGGAGYKGWVVIRPL